MKVYFVRHGQSILNARNIHQRPDTPLSKLGEKQARFLAKRFKKIKIEKIIASPYERAKKTAEIINGELKLIIDFSELVQECRRPSEVWGVENDSPLNIEIQKQIEDNFDNLNWHYSDEENFADRRKRAIKIIKLLENIKKESVLVVSHGTFLRYITGVLMFGKEMNAPQYLVWESFTKADNTGISLCEFNREKNKWHLLTWNDYAHLGEE